MIIIISGTPGTGKTTLAKKLAFALNYKYVDIKKLIKSEKISDSYDKKRNCFVVDTKKLNKLLIQIISDYKKKDSKFKGLIIDSHLSHYLLKKYVDLCIITKCDLKRLETRLKKRRYNQQKVRENLDAEIFDICRQEALEKNHKILTIDTTKGIKINKLLVEIKKWQKQYLA